MVHPQVYSLPTGHTASPLLFTEGALSWAMQEITIIFSWHVTVFKFHAVFWSHITLWFRRAGIPFCLGHWEETEAQEGPSTFHEGLKRQQAFPGHGLPTRIPQWEMLGIHFSFSALKNTVTWALSLSSLCTRSIKNSTCSQAKETERYCLPRPLSGKNKMKTKCVSVP